MKSLSARKEQVSPEIKFGKTAFSAYLPFPFARERPEPIAVLKRLKGGGNPCITVSIGNSTSWKGAKKTVAAGKSPSLCAPRQTYAALA